MLPGDPVARPGLGRVWRATAPLSSPCGGAACDDPPWASAASSSSTSATCLMRARASEYVHEREADRRLQPLRGDLRPRADDRGPRRRRRARQPGRSPVPRAHLPEGGGDRRRVRRPRPVAAPGPSRRRGHRRPVAGDRLGRGVRPGRRQPRARDQRARRRRARRLPRQPQRPQPGVDDARHRDVQVVPDEEPLLRHLGRPAPPPARGAPDLRPPALPADPRHRPHVVVPRGRRQPDGVQRLADDGARLPAARSATSGRAAAGWSSSTRAAPRPPRWPTSTTSSAPAPTRGCCSRCCTSSPPRPRPTTCPPWRRTSTGWTRWSSSSPSSPPSAPRR